MLALHSLTADIQRTGVTIGDQVPVHPKVGRPGYIWHYTVLVSAQWVLYDRQGLVVDSALVSARTPFVFSAENTRSLTILTPSPAQSGASISAAAKANGQIYAQRLSAKDIVVNRPYYRTGDLAPAAEWIKARNWPVAAALLLPLASSGSSPVSIKAAYNLAILSEAQGNREEARLWAQQAAQAGDGLARKMLADLDKNR
ncbi:DUF6340 family protein [Rufibacter glacialis]|uniref:DUF6340 family protein n=1 Tax=Rufibacter glacialis TaxID=1259555 RepID=A0A5M8QI92_9BACT|nr:DUF6340 family protein [Rufibacter glacialis]KAA6434670.1 hypothetical protein FOE74_10850 [Rufibacter glacialis]GGK71493.1 hypothetical protein GCM10011405_19590 [Rufibacter glacialis]